MQKTPVIGALSIQRDNKNGTKHRNKKTTSILAILVVL
jgi:hypothetical protein